MNRTSTENISRRPTSIMVEQNHLLTAGISDHDIVGPISTPNVGPTFDRQDRHIVMELITSMPMAVKNVADTKKSPR